MVLDLCLHPWDYRVTPFRVAGNLYYVGNSYVSSHLIDTGQGLILLDTALPQSVYLLLESVRRLGFDPDDIGYILHSHGHYDHLGGTRAIAALTGAKTALGKEDIEILQERPKLSWAPEYGVEFYESFDVDIPLVDGQIISLGGTSIECVHTPGHTAGCMSFFFDVEERDTGWSAGIFGGPGLNTLTDEYLDKYGLSPSRRACYLASVQRLKNRHVDIFLGAHPAQNDALRKSESMNSARNPFIDATAWTKYVEGLENAAMAAFGSV